MDSNTQAQLDNRISVLPKDLQDLLKTPWKSSLRVIADRQSLTDDQKESLETEVFLVLAGLEPLSSFRTNIVNEVGVTYDQAIKIASDTNSNIFNSVTGILKNIEKDIEQVDIEEEGMEENTLSATNILNAQFEDEAKVSAQSTTRAAAQNPRVSADTEPSHLIPDHDQLTKTDGPHAHTQNVAIKPQTAPTVAAPVSQTSQSAQPTQSPKPTPAPAFKSIVDQKLSGLVRSSNAPANLPTNQKDLEEMMKKSEGVKIGYKGIDPYREPIE